MYLHAAALLGAISIFQLSSELPAPEWLLPLLAVTVLLYWVRRLRILATFCFGLAWSLIHAHFLLPEPLPKELEGKDVEVVGVVDSLPVVDGSRLRFELRLEEAYRLGEPVRIDGRLRLSWYQKEKDTEMRPGQRWRLQVRLKRAHGMANPGGFDYERWLYKRDIRATGYVRSGVVNQLLNESAGLPLQRLRHDLRQHLRQVLEERPQAALLIALAMGDRADITPEQWRVFTASGTNHLMAISGLHIGLVAGMAYLLFTTIWRWSRAGERIAAPKVGVVVALLAAAMYAALAGFAVPTQRALTMLIVGLGAMGLQRHVAWGRVLALAMIAVLLLDPFAMLEVGFWLSFAVVAAFLLFMGGTGSKDTLWLRWGRASWVAFIALLPLLALFFGQLPLISLVANVVAVPWTSLIVVPLTLLGTGLLNIAEPIAVIFLFMADQALSWQWYLLEKLVQWVPAHSVTAPPPLLIGLALIGVIWLLAPVGWPHRWLGLLPLFALLFHQPQRPAEGDFRFTLLDVGQGLAAVVETHNHVMVFDTGPRFSDRFDTGDAVVAPYLRSAGWHQIDTLVVSHGHNDHIGGVWSLLEALPAGRILTSVVHKLDRAAVAPEPCRAGQSWQWDGVKFTVLHPDDPEGIHMHGNNDSCVVRITGEGGTLLLTGDIEAYAENVLLETYSDDLRSDVLVVPHHGSNTSSGPSFVAAVRPRMALFASGYRNRHRFPHPKVEQRYAGIGAAMLNTGYLGAITLDFRAMEGTTLRCERVARRRYWQNPLDAEVAHDCASPFLPGAVSR